MTLIRVRLSFDRPQSIKSERCWMLVDTSSCKLVHDLEYLILKKFFRDGHNILNLYLEDFLLPSQEKIEVIRDNDVIRVEEDKYLPTKKVKSRKSNDNDKDFRSKLKRKPEESNDSKSKSKKIKLSPSKKKEGQNVELAKQLKHSNHSEFAFAKTSINNFRSKSNSEKAADLLNKISKDNIKEVSRNKTTSNDSSQKEKKGQSKSAKSKLKSDASGSVLEKQNSTSNNKQTGSHPVVVDVLKNGLISSLPPRLKKGNVESVQDINGDDRCEGIASKNTDIGKTDKQNKKTSAALLSKKPSTPSSSTTSTTSSSLSSSSSDDMDDANIIQKNNFNGLTSSKTNKPGQGLKLSVASKDVNKNMLHTQSQQFDNYHSKQSNHIRFDSESGDENVATNVESIPCPSVSLAYSGSVNTSAINGTSRLSQIQSSLEDTTNIENIQKEPRKEIMRKGRHRAIDFRKDVYTNKSIVLESTRVEKGPQETCRAPDITERDFSKYQLLHGPPRVGETVAYKILELSQSYTPEISKYKEGKVLEFDSVSNQLKLKLTKESLSRATGDGNISFKFELFDDKETDEVEESTLPVEIPDEVEVHWSSMIEPRLVMAPGIAS